MSLDKSIQEVMSQRVTKMEASENLFQAIQAMAHANIGLIVVTDGGEAVGVFSERDLMKRVVAKGLNPKDTNLGSVMTPKLIQVAPETPIKDVIQKMYTLAIRHILIMKGRELVGIFSLRDLLRHLLV